MSDISLVLLPQQVIYPIYILRTLTRPVTLYANFSVLDILCTAASCCSRGFTGALRDVPSFKPAYKVRVLLPPRIVGYAAATGARLHLFHSGGSLHFRALL